MERKKSRYIRSNPEQFEKMMKRREVSINSSEILDIDNGIRSYQTKMQVLQEKRNKASKEIGQMIAQGSDISDVKKNIYDYKTELAFMDEKVKDLTLQLNNLLIELPNSLDENVPEGKTDDDNIFVKSWGEKPNFAFKPIDHVEIGEKFNKMDFKRGVKISGSRFVLLRGQLALLERA